MNDFLLKVCELLLRFAQTPQGEIVFGAVIGFMIGLPFLLIFG
jgi:hypothetical protein